MFTGYHELGPIYPNQMHILFMTNVLVIYIASGWRYNTYNRSHSQTTLIAFPRPGNGFTQTGIIKGVAAPQVQC